MKAFLSRDETWACYQCSGQTAILPLGWSYSISTMQNTYLNHKCLLANQVLDSQDLQIQTQISICCVIHWHMMQSECRVETLVLIRIQSKCFLHCIRFILFIYFLPKCFLMQGLKTVFVKCLQNVFMWNFCQVFAKQYKCSSCVAWQVSKVQLTICSNRCSKKVSLILRLKMYSIFLNKWNNRQRWNFFSGLVQSFWNKKKKKKRFVNE